MTCPYLAYLRRDDDHEFDHERPWCGAEEAFVSPMRADICNDRFAFDHACDCEVFREAVEEGAPSPGEPVEPADPIE